MPTAHIGYTQLEDTAAAIKIAQTVGIKTIYCPAPPTADYREGKGDWARARPRASRRIGKAPQRRRHRLRLSQPPLGIRQGRRRQAADRHAARRRRRRSNGRWTSPGWCKAGEDPVAWMDKLGSRITAIHVKDIAPGRPGARRRRLGRRRPRHARLEVAARRPSSRRPRRSISSPSTTSRSTRCALRAARSTSVKKWRLSNGARPTASASWVPATSRAPICGSRRCSRASRSAASPTSCPTRRRSAREEFGVQAHDARRAAQELRDRRDRQPHGPGDALPGVDGRDLGRQARLFGKAVRAVAQGRQGAEEGRRRARPQVGSAPDTFLGGAHQQVRDLIDSGSSARSRTAPRT